MLKSIRPVQRLATSLLLLIAAPFFSTTARCETAFQWLNFAGMSCIGTSDGTGTAARFYNPAGAAVDASGNVYVADTWNHTIRKVTPAGMVSTLAGLGGNSGSADATGSAARFNWPEGVAVDSSGNLYVADTRNHTIRKITPAGVVSTLAGLAGNSGSVNGTGSAARFCYPEGVAVDGSGIVFVADRGNHRISMGVPLLSTTLPTVALLISGDITAIEAALGANVINEGGATVTERGVVCAVSATNSNPDIGGPGVIKVACSGTTGVFTVNVSGLAPGTSYSFKAYATNSVGTSYTSVSSFTTLSATQAAVAWAVGNGLAGADVHPTATPFGDGVPNLLKYAFKLGVRILLGVSRKQQP